MLKIAQNINIFRLLRHQRASKLLYVLLLFATKLAEYLEKFEKFTIIFEKLNQNFFKNSKIRKIGEEGASSKCQKNLHMTFTATASKP